MWTELMWTLFMWTLLMWTELMWTKLMWTELMWTRFTWTGEHITHAPIFSWWMHIIAIFCQSPKMTFHFEEPGNPADMSGGIYFIYLKPLQVFPWAYWHSDLRARFQIDNWRRDTILTVKLGLRLNTFIIVFA